MKVNVVQKTKKNFWCYYKDHAIKMFGKMT